MDGTSVLSNEVAWSGHNAWKPPVTVGMSEGSCVPAWGPGRPGCWANEETTPFPGLRQGQAQGQGQGALGLPSSPEGYSGKMRLFF
jgi:hypothetical protein